MASETAPLPAPRVRLDGAGSDEVTPATVVAGLPLALRLVRQLHAAGAREVLCETAGPEAPWRARLAAYPPPPGLAVRFVPPAADADAACRLSGAALYRAADLAACLAGAAPAPAPWLEPRTRADLAVAERVLYDSIKKTVAHDGHVAYYLVRPLSRPLSRALLKTRVTPNAVTAVGLLVGLASGVVAGLGGYGATLLATLGFALGLLLDCVDGELARLSLATSRRGQWLDTLADDLAVIALTAGLGVGLYRTTGHLAYLVVGLAVAVAVAAGQAAIYAALVRQGGPIDTARYPWFFLGREGFQQQGARSLVGVLALVFRRDALTVLFLGLALLGLGPVILGLLALGGGAYAVLAVVDRLVKRWRR